MFKRKLRNHILTLACLLGTGYTFTDETTEETSLVSHITHRYLTSTFGTEKPVIVTPVNDTDLTFIEKIKKLFAANTQTISQREVQETAFSLINNQIFQTDIIDSSCIDKLEFVGGSENNQRHLFGTIFNTHINTAIGTAYTALTLCHPTTDITIIHNRQQAIKSINANKQYLHKIDSALKVIQNAENKSLTFWQTKPLVNPQALQFLYFSKMIDFGGKLNTSTLALEATSIKVNQIFNIASNLIGLPMAIKNRDNIIPESFKPYMKPLMPYMTGYLLISIPFQQYFNALQVQGSLEICNHLQGILIASASHIKELKKLSSLVNKNKQLLNNLPSLQPLADFNDSTKHSAQLNKLLGMLDTNTFKGEPSFWSITGRVFAAYELMKQVKDELAPVFAAAGELDMYVALAKLYSSREGKQAQYCMVNFVENSTTPVIDAQNFWNPFINPDTVVINNATFDASCPNSILTGPNTGGKSTVIKGIMINVLMAQTFGIAPSSSLTLTPFSKLNCFMNISDDIATGASLFKSEVMRAKKLLDMVQGLKENEFSFVIIDEVFTGTSPQEGEMAALRFAKTLGAYINNTSIIATHYPKMVNLYEETNGMFHNHHVEILRNEDGSLNRTFKLKNGPSFFNVAFDILEEEGLFV